jgi:glycine/D-amino acid oxidase-like deaminating enzyme
MGAAAVSFWLTQLPPSQPRPSLSGSRTADVCIVGGGFTGLWTAYELLRREPSLEVVVLEANEVGFGASGRNGGWVEGSLAGDREHWAARGGREGVIALERAMHATVDEIGRIAERERIACDFKKGGALFVAQTPLEAERVRGAVEDDRAWGVADEDSVLLDGAQARARVAVDGVVAARWFRHCARVQPARLVRGLGEAAERAGATIYERTAVRRIEPGIAQVDAGEVRAGVIVRATEAYTADLEGQHRVMLPLFSSVIATEPLGPSVWSEIGWEQAETLADGRRRYIYAQRTADDRIVIGGRGVPYRFGSPTDAENPPPNEAAVALRTRLVELFPSLTGARVEGTWQGVLGVPRQWAPAVGIDRSTGFAWGGGYVGEGVAAANLAGRTLADLILERDSELTTLPWVGSMGRRWLPEPLRFAAVRGVNLMMRAADSRELATGRDSMVGHAAHLISGR